MTTSAGVSDVLAHKQVTCSAHGSKQQFSRMVNRELFSLAWAKPPMCATGASAAARSVGQNN